MNAGGSNLLKVNEPEPDTEPENITSGRVILGPIRHSSPALTEQITVLRKVARHESVMFWPSVKHR